MDLEKHILGDHNQFCTHSSYSYMSCIEIASRNNQIYQACDQYKVKRREAVGNVVICSASEEGDPLSPGR